MSDDDKRLAVKMLPVAKIALEEAYKNRIGHLFEILVGDLADIDGPNVDAAKFQCMKSFSAALSLLNTAYDAAEKVLNGE